MRSFIVAGPVSSGNRVMTGILVRAGLSGEGSTNQPVSFDDINYDLPSVMITHHKVKKWIDAFKGHGHAVTVIIMIRESFAQAHSAMTRGHFSDIDTAFIDAQMTISRNILEATEAGCIVDFVSYESLCPEMIPFFLNRHGLRFDNINERLNLVGQLAPDQPTNMNAAHYQPENMTAPPHEGDCYEY